MTRRRLPAGHGRGCAVSDSSNALTLPGHARHMTDHRADTGAIASAVHHVVIGCNEHDGDKTSSNHSHESIPLCCSRYFRTIRPLRHSNRDRRSHRRRQTERFEVRDLITLPRALLARALCVFKKRLRGSQKHRVRAQNLNCRRGAALRALPSPPTGNSFEPFRTRPAMPGRPENPREIRIPTP